MMSVSHAVRKGTEESRKQNNGKICSKIRWNSMKKECIPRC